MRTKLLFLGFIIGVLLMPSCRTDIIYSHFQSIPTEKWVVDSIARFEYSIVDTAPTYQMLIYVRHTERYPFQNMWLFVDNGLKQDTIEFYLADDRGQWLGNRHHGFIEMPVLYEEHYHFPDTGVYQLNIQHAMRDSLLRGIMDIGVEIIRNGEE